MSDTYFIIHTYTDHGVTCGLFSHVENTGAETEEELLSYFKSTLKEWGSAWMSNHGVYAWIKKVQPDVNLSEMEDEEYTALLIDLVNKHTTTPESRTEFLRALQTGDYDPIMIVKAHSPDLFLKFLSEHK